MAGKASYAAVKAAVAEDIEDVVKCASQLGITVEWVLASLKHIAENSPKDRDKLKALDMITKLTGWKPPERVFVSADETNWKIAYTAEESDGE